VETISEEVEGSAIRVLNPLTCLLGGKVKKWKDLQLLGLVLGRVLGASFSLPQVRCACFACCACFDDALHVLVACIVSWGGTEVVLRA
jgi:hypothetical protein